MPEKEGLETLIELRKEFPQAGMIAMSGSRIAELMLKSAEGLGAVRSAFGEGTVRPKGGLMEY